MNIRVDPIFKLYRRLNHRVCRLSDALNEQHQKILRIRYAGFVGISESEWLYENNCYKQIWDAYDDACATLDAVIDTINRYKLEVPLSIERAIARRWSASNRKALRTTIQIGIIECRQFRLKPNDKTLLRPLGVRDATQILKLKPRAIRYRISSETDALSIGSESASPLTEPNHNTHVGGAYHDYAQLSHRRDRRATSVSRMAIPSGRKAH